MGDEVLRTWKDYFEDLYNIHTKEPVAAHMKSGDELCYIALERYKFSSNVILPRTN